MAAPRGESGARLDTAAGRAAEAAFQERKAAAIAQAAMAVAQSEAAHGRAESAATAVAAAQNAAMSAAPNVQQAVQAHVQQLQTGQSGAPAIPGIAQIQPGTPVTMQPGGKAVTYDYAKTVEDRVNKLLAEGNIAGARLQAQNITGGGSGVQNALNRINTAIGAASIAASRVNFKPQGQTFPVAGPGDGVVPEEPKPAPAPQNLRPPMPTPPVQQRQSIVRSPNRDVINFQREEYSLGSMTRLLFEQVGSIELINVARRDTIEGQNPYYSLISNLSSIRKNFNPTSLISRQRVNETIFDNYTINLDSKIPDQDYLDANNLENFYYIASNGDLVIELDNLAEDERIEVEIAQSGTINLVDEV